MPLLFKMVVLLVSQCFPAFGILIARLRFFTLLPQLLEHGVQRPHSSVTHSLDELDTKKDTKRTPKKCHKKTPQKTPQKCSRSSRSVEACQDPLECGTEFGADIGTNVIWRYLNIDGSQNLSHGLHNLHMCPANNLDRFKGRKDDKDVLTHSLHVAYAAEDVPYATVVWLTRILNAWWLHMGFRAKLGKLWAPRAAAEVRPTHSPPCKSAESKNW